jgi:anti-sigma factor RsiW
MSGPIHRARVQRDHVWAPRHMSAYLDRELASRARARMLRHTGECPECRGLLYSLTRMLDMVARLAPGAFGHTADIAPGVRRRLAEPNAR